MMGITRGSVHCYGLVGYHHGLVGGIPVSLPASSMEEHPHHRDEARCGLFRLRRYSPESCDTQAGVVARPVAGTAAPGSGVVQLGLTPGAGPNSRPWNTTSFTKL